MAGRETFSGTRIFDCQKLGFLTVSAHSQSRTVNFGAPEIDCTETVNFRGRAEAAWAAGARRQEYEGIHTIQPPNSFFLCPRSSLRDGGRPPDTNPHTVRYPKPRIARPTGPGITGEDDPLAETIRGQDFFSVSGGRIGPLSPCASASPGWSEVVPVAPAAGTPSPAPGAGPGR